MKVLELTYDFAYKEADTWVEDKNDKNLQEVISKLNDSEQGIIRDRIADALVIGSQHGADMIKTVKPCKFIVVKERWYHRLLGLVSRNKDTDIIMPIGIATIKIGFNKKRKLIANFSCDIGAGEASIN